MLGVLDGAPSRVLARQLALLLLGCLLWCQPGGVHRQPQELQVEGGVHSTAAACRRLRHLTCNFLPHLADAPSSVCGAEG